MDRLTQAIHPAGSGLTAEDYGYDKVGNRENPGDAAAYDYDKNNQITKSPGIISYVFDNDGNMTGNSSGEIFNYNKLNRLTSYTKSGATSTYLYDPTGRRINKTVVGNTTWFLWDGESLIAEYNSSGTQGKRYAYLPGEHTPVQVTDAGGIYDVHTDNLGTPRLLTDGAKSIVWQAQYESFGGVNLITNSVEFNFRFPGQYYDGESGLYYNHFRDYDPRTGRYIEGDPIGNIEGDINIYRYAYGNPNAYIDPLGLQNIINSSSVKVTVSKVTTKKIRFDYMRTNKVYLPATVSGELRISVDCQCSSADNVSIPFSIDLAVPIYDLIGGTAGVSNVPFIKMIKMYKLANLLSTSAKIELYRRELQDNLDSDLAKKVLEKNAGLICTGKYKGGNLFNSIILQPGMI